MIFQVIDQKKDCNKFYYEDDLHSSINKECINTWSYSSHLKNIPIQYAQLYCEGKSLQECCPDSLKKELEDNIKKINSFKKSFFNAKVSLEDNCFFDLLPKKYIIDYCRIKSKITKYVLENYKKPTEYDFLNNFNQILTDIKNRDLNIDFSFLKKNITNEKDLKFYKKIIDTNKFINYNLFGSITGRLTTKKDSFPIQNFPKNYRSIIKPTNDYFVAFDMNAAELRTSLALVDKDQPEEDLYEMLRREVFENELTRAQIKPLVTSWLYNSSNSIKEDYSLKLDDIFLKETLLNTHWDGNFVYTPYNRKIPSDKFHAIPYLNQSTFIDLFHRQSLKLNKFLEKKHSFISFFIHDELVLDLKEEEKSDIIEMIKILEDTEYGKFIVNVKVGKNFGNMKKINLKV